MYFSKPISNLTDVQSSLVDWLRPYRWDIFITLEFDFNVTRSTADQRVTKFLTGLNRIVFPPRSGIPHKLNTFSVCEHHKSGRWHTHIATGGPIPFGFYETKALAEELWVRGRTEYRRQLKASKTRRCNAQKMRFSVPNAIPKCVVENTEVPCDFSSRKCWFKKIDHAQGLFEYLSKDSKKCDSTYFISPENTNLNILA